MTASIMSSERVKEAKDFLSELIKSRKSSEEILTLDDVARKEKLRECLLTVYNAAVKLNEIGYEKLEKAEKFLRDNIESFICFYPHTALRSNADIMESRTTRFLDEISYNDIDEAMKTIRTYEILAPWLEKIEEYRIVSGLDKILEKKNEGQQKD